MGLVGGTKPLVSSQIVVGAQQIPIVRQEVSTGT